MTGAERDREMRDVVREVLRELVPGVLGEVTARPADGHTGSAGTTNGNGHAGANGNGRAIGKRATKGDGHRDQVIPRVPAPPVAAVLRPSTWKRPPEPGEVIGGVPAAPASEATSGSERSPRASASTPAAPRPERLRAAFRESEFKPSRGAPAPATAGEATDVEVVAIATDEDLEQFVRQLMARLENPRERLAIRTGRLRFTLARMSGTPPAGGGVAQATAPAMRVERGAVTERMIRAAAADGTRLILARAAVLTPLAREQAKAWGVDIERERRC